MRTRFLVSILFLLVMIAIGGAWGQSTTNRRFLGGPDQRIPLAPGEKLGMVELGIAKAGIFERMNLLAAETIGKEHDSTISWPYEWPGLGPIHFWPGEATLLGACRSNNKIFFAGVVLVRDELPDYKWLNSRVAQVTTPEGLTISSGHARFREVYGDPQQTLRDFGNEGTDLQILPDGVAIRVNPRIKSGRGLGVHNRDICAGGTTPKGPRLPWLGRDVRINPLFFSRTGDEAKGVIGEPIRASGPAHKFGIGQPIYAGVDMITTKSAVGRNAEFAREWSCGGGPKATWRFTRTIQQGGSGEGMVRLVGGINMRDRQIGTCTIRFIVGRDTELVATQFVLE